MIQVKGEIQTRKNLQWISKHPETRKGIVIDKMLRRVENKHRSRDFRIGQSFELLLNPWTARNNMPEPGEKFQPSHYNSR